MLALSPASVFFLALELDWGRCSRGGADFGIWVQNSRLRLQFTGKKVDLLAGGLLPISRFS